MVWYIVSDNFTNMTLFMVLHEFTTGTTFKHLKSLILYSTFFSLGTTVRSRLHFQITSNLQKDGRQRETHLSLII